MVRALAVALLLGVAFTPTLACGERMPNDGFYRITDGGLGERLQLRVLSAEINAENNFNTSFQLHVSTPYTEAERPAFVLWVAGRTYRTSSTGSQQGVTRTYTFRITDVGEARAIASYLGIQPTLRKHPGHLLATRFTTDKREYRVGDAVTAELTIENVGQKTLRFMDGGRNRGARNNQFSFAAQLDNRPYPDSGDPIHFGGSAGVVVLKPGQKFTKKVELGKWYKLDHPGLYSIVGAFYLAFVPADDFAPVLWEDYVAAPFYVHMKP